MQQLKKTGRKEENHHNVSVSEEKNEERTFQNYTMVKFVLAQLKNGLLTS